MNPSTHSSNDIHAFFQENGYYLAKNVFSGEEISSMETDFDRIVSQLQGSGEEINARWDSPEMEKMGTTESVIFHTHNVQQYSAVWLQALLNPRFLNIAEAIMGPDIILHHSKLFQKPPEKGAPFPMHQDWSYFPSEKDSLIAGIIHVSNATNEMGCLKVVPGSHKLGRLENSSGQTASDIYEKYPLEEALALEAEPGDVAFFHYFTLHGSMPNTSDKTRKTVLAQLYRGDDRIEEGNTHPNERLTLKGWHHSMKRGQANAAK